MAYSEKVIDHYENPRNVGKMDAEDPDVGTGMVGAPACGDVMRLQIKVNEAGVIEDAKFKTYGCGSAIASSSLATEWMKGKTLDEAVTIKQHPVGRRTGPAASENPLLRTRRRRHQGGRSRLQAEERLDLKHLATSKESTMAISMTEAAAQHIRRSLNGRGKGEGIRLGVRTTGCSGLAYVLEFVDEVVEEDQVFESHGEKVIIDPKSLTYLDGTELDFVKEGLSEGFKFNNPNVRGECGCGESFNI